MNRKKVITLTLVAIALIAIISLAFSFFLKNRDNNGSVDSSQDDIGEIVFYRTEMEHVATDPEGFMYVDNEILIVASANTSYSDIYDLAKGINAEIVGWIEQTGDYQLKLNKTYTEDQLNELIDSLNENQFVDSAYINFASPIDSTKTEERNGFYFGDEWENDLQNFNNCKGDSWGIEAIEVLAAWDILDMYKRNVNPVKVGLIDRAFDTNHEDLGFAETFYNVDSGRDHGTHVAGTMAAKTDNREGICGVYPYGNGNLYGVSYSGICNFSENGNPITTSMFLKIAYAELILRDVKVINSSLGFNYYQWPLSYSDPEWDEQVAFLESNAYVLGDFLDRLLDKGYDFVLINAAGNDSDRSSGIVYDSKYNFWTTVISKEEYPNVYDRIIVVGAVNSDYEICNFSNGGNRVDIFAPGDTIFSTTPNNNYANQNWSGTSMAAPHVSGVAAMVWSVNNELTGAQVKEIVCSSHSFRCTACNMVDAYVAMRKATHTDDTTDSTAPANGAILCWVVSAEDDDIKIENAVVTVHNTQTDEEFSTATDSMGHFEIFVPAGTYNLVVKAEGYEDFVWPNNNEPYTVSISVDNGKVNYLDDWIKIQPTQKQLAEADINAINSLLIGVGYPPYQVEGTIASWSDERIFDIICCKRLWDWNATYLAKLGIGDEFSIDLSLVEELTLDIFGRSFPVNAQSGLGSVAANKLNVELIMGESTELVVQNGTKQGNRVTVVGSVYHHYVPFSEFCGYFSAELEENPSSIYGYTLTSIYRTEGNQNFDKLIASASSELKEGSLTHDANRVIDGDSDTAWVEGVRGVGINEWIKLETTDGSKMTVSAIEFSLGYQKNKQLLQNNGWPNKVLIECESGYTQEKEFYTCYNSDVVVLDQPQTTGWIKVTILEATSGAKYDDICISEIRMYGIDPNGEIVIDPSGGTVADVPDDSGSLSTELGLSADSAHAIVDIYVPFCQSLSDTYISSDGSVAKQRSCLVVEFESGSPNLIVHYWVPNAYDPGQFCEAWTIYGIASGKVVKLYSDENYAPTRREIDMVYDDAYGFALREEQTGGYYELIIHYPENVTDTAMYENYNYIQLSKDSHTLRVWTISGDYVDIRF